MHVSLACEYHHTTESPHPNNLHFDTCASAYTIHVYVFFLLVYLFFPLVFVLCILQAEGRKFVYANDKGCPVSCMCPGAGACMSTARGACPLIEMRKYGNC